MATKSDFTFSAFNLTSQNAVNAVAVATATHFRDRNGEHKIAQPGDYVVKDEDDGLRLFKKALFEAEYTAQGAVTAPSSLVFSGQTVAAIDLSWTIGDATALPKIYRAGVLVGTNVANDNTFTDSGLAPNTAYAYQIINVKNERPSTALAATGYTLPAPVAIAPTSPAHAATTINIAWVNVDPTAKTRIYVDDGLGGAFTLFSTEAAGATTKQITGLTTSRTYLIKLKHEGVLSGLASATFSPTLSQVTS